MSTDRSRLTAIRENIAERVGARPVHLAVFLAALVGIAVTSARTSGMTRMPAVAVADPVRHPSPAATFVTEVFVRPGDRVEEGTPLALLSDRLLREELALLDARIERVHREAEMSLARVSWEYHANALGLQSRMEEARRRERIARAERTRGHRLAGEADALHRRLLERLDERLARLSDVEEAEWTRELMQAEADEAAQRSVTERDAVADARSQLEAFPELLSLSEPVLTYYEASLRTLYVERARVIEALGRLTVLSAVEGRVSMVLPVGASAGSGTTVAEVVPERAIELVAYATPDTNPATLSQGTPVTISASGCELEGAIGRTGARVVQAPDQLQTRIFTPVRGLPFHVPLPDTCRLGVGQVGTVELSGKQGRRRGAGEHPRAP